MTKVPDGFSVWLISLSGKGDPLLQINTFQCKPEDVDCTLCTKFKGKKRGCTAKVCPWLAERIEAGVVGYEEAVRETFPHDAHLDARLRVVVRHFTGSLFLSPSHERRMERVRIGQGCRRRRNTPAYYRSTSNGPYGVSSTNCAGWATLCSDTAFGNLPWRRVDRPSWEQIRAGDLVEYRNGTTHHVVVVLDRTDEYISTTESGTNNKARWGGQYPQWWLEDQPTYILYTRYPQ